MALERCGSRVIAGWNVERIKDRLQQSFLTAATEPEFTTAQRRRIASRAERLVGRRRAYLQRAVIADGTLTMEVDEAAVYDFEVNRWIRTIARTEPVDRT